MHLDEHPLARLVCPHLWQTLSPDDTACIVSNPAARQIIAHYRHHIRSLELKNTDLIDHCGLACTGLTHLQLEQNKRSGNLSEYKIHIQCGHLQISGRLYLLSNATTLCGASNL